MDSLEEYNEIIKLNKNIIVFKTYFKGIFINSFLLFGKSINLLVDSGLSITSNEIEEHIKGKNILLNYILNTHSHWDHIGSNGFLKKNTGAKIIIHENGKRYAEDFDLEWYEEYENEYWKSDDEVKRYYYKMIGEKFKVDLTFKEELNIYSEIFNLKVFKFLGHSNDSICIYDKEKKFLFSGDSIMGSGINNNLNTFSNPSELRKNLIDLRDNVEIDAIFPSHHDLITGKRKINIFLNESIDEIRLIEERIKREIKSYGKNNITEITKNACKHLKKDFNNLAIMSVYYFIKSIENNKN